MVMVPQLCKFIKSHNILQLNVDFIVFKLFLSPDIKSEPLKISHLVHVMITPITTFILHCNRSYNHYNEARKINKIMRSQKEEIKANI